MIHDVLPAFRRVASHIKAEDRRHAVPVVEAYGRQAHSRADEVFEFRRRDFSKTFESRHFGSPQFLSRRVSPGFRITVHRFSGIAHPKERRLQNVHVSVMDDGFKETQEESE